MQDEAGFFTVESFHRAFRSIFRIWGVYLTRPFSKFKLTVSTIVHRDTACDLRLCLIRVQRPCADLCRRTTGLPESRTRPSERLMAVSVKRLWNARWESKRESIETIEIVERDPPVTSVPS
jgi:hypothetical protein